MAAALVLAIVFFNYQREDHWLPGVIHEKTGPVCFRVNVSDGPMRACHLDQVRVRRVKEPYRPELEEIPNTTSSVPEMYPWTKHHR